MPSRRPTCRSFLQGAICHCLLLLAPHPAAAQTAAPAIPSHLPHYDLDIRLDVERHQVTVLQRVHWTNPHRTPTSKVVFNVHSHYTIPSQDVGFLAKMLEILRLSPSEAFDFDGPPCEVRKVALLREGAAVTPAKDGVRDTVRELPFHYQEKNATALEVQLPAPVGPGQGVTLDLAFTLRLPQKQGRWGQWKGVTFLAQWLPVVAFYDDQGWQPTP